jgi:hypothetical protein
MYAVIPRRGETLETYSRLSFELACVDLHVGSLAPYGIESGGSFLPMGLYYGCDAETRNTNRDSTRCGLDEMAN